MDYSYHKPVMLSACIEGLNIKPDGVYVDLTFGGGGHSKEILKHLSSGKLYGFDQDEDAQLEAKKITDPNFIFIKSNFKNLLLELNKQNVMAVDGILADLGISSHQIDTPERGFSTRFEGEIDMRMDTSHDLTAADILNTYSQDSLHKIFGMYAELKNARTAAAAVVNARSNKPFSTLTDLKDALISIAPRGKEFKYFAQVFQGLRIEVNQEMQVLEEMLVQIPDALKKGGRFVVMSYHSLEDRPVKNFIKTGKLSGQVEKDFYGNEIKPLISITRKPVEASPEEIIENPRSRSAKLRVAEKA